MASVAALALAAASALASPLARGQALQLVGADVQKRANGVLAMMGYMLTPDVTTGSLAISNNTTGNPDFGMSTLGGGFTSEGSRLYLEGTLGYATYDPTFIASNGQAQGSVAAKWDGPLQGRRARHGLVDRTGGQLLTCLTARGIARAKCSG